MRMDRTQSSEHLREGKGAPVVAIECLTGSSTAEEWNGEMLQTGDILEELKIGNLLWERSPFKNGKSGVQKLLQRSYKKNETSIQVRVRRGKDEFVELQACIVPVETASGKKQYMLRSIHDPNYAVGFVDKTESECYALQAQIAFDFSTKASSITKMECTQIERSRSSRVVCALSNAQLQDGYVSYPWEKKMKETLSVTNSSSFLSILLLPKASDPAASRYNDLEDTLARANAWLTASQASGVPIVFMNIQTEALLTKISGETASATVNAGSLSDLSNLANASLYGFEDYHGVDIGVVRAVRLWYAPIVEVAIEIKLKEGDSRLGFAISRTEEGFIYISSVADDDDNEPTASTRAGLKDLYRQAVRSCKLLIVSRLANDKVLPWMVSPTGAIRCFDTVSLSQKLSLHRHALKPINIHVFLWDRGLATLSESSIRLRTVSLPMMPMPPPIQFSRSPTVNHLPTDSSGQMLDRDTAGELSFRFHDFSLRSNWV